MKALIEQATQFLKGKIHRTPVEYSPELSKILDQPTYLKTRVSASHRFL